MPIVSGDMPLLPLPAVLFPGVFLPVQVAEASQRRLLRACVDEGRHVGVVLAPGEEGSGRAAVPCTTGCVASIALLLYEDGSDQPVNAILHGERRMRVVEFSKESYLTGRIETLDEYPGLHAERRCRQAIALFQQYIALVRRRYQSEVADLVFPQDPAQVSYMLASLLFISLEVKQRWLESASAAHRLQEQLAFLHAECEKLATFLALTERTQHHYASPDYARCVSLISRN